MDELTDVERSFVHSLTRARGLCEYQDYMKRTFGPTAQVDDILRASVVLGVSAFDYFVHELIRAESLRRFKSKRSIVNMHFPFEAVIAPEADRLALIDTHVRGSIAHKTFVDPQKFAEALGCFVPKVWDEVATDAQKSAKDLKARLRAIYRWRNRIAHEADINPTLAGIELWPILKEDVEAAITDIELIGLSTIRVIRKM